MGAFDAELAQMRRQRQFWHELDDPPRRALQLTRVRVEELMATPTKDQILELMKRHVIGWRGFSMADLIGAHVGSTDPLEWSEELFREWIPDFPEVLLAAWGSMVAQLNQVAKLREDAAKN